MNCPECGGGPMVTTNENYRYEPSEGLFVTLVGIPVSRCKECGVHAPKIHAIGKLHRAIAAALVNKPGRLAPPEVRFLRKHLGWSGTDFAAHMGVTPETVSRWENSAKEREQIGPQADRLLRLLVLTREPEKDYKIDSLKSIERGAAGPVRLGMHVVKENWQLVGT